VDQHEIVTPGDAKGSAVAEVRSVMLADGHELVAFGHVERFAHRLVESVENGLPVGGGLALAQGDMDERHGEVLLIGQPGKNSRTFSRSVKPLQNRRIQVLDEKTSSTLIG
jgi:hypothetical protein